MTRRQASKQKAPRLRRVARESQEMAIIAGVIATSVTQRTRAIGAE
jgi:hypothetical protein